MVLEALSIHTWTKNHQVLWFYAAPDRLPLSPLTLQATLWELNVTASPGSESEWHSLSSAQPQALSPESICPLQDLQSQVAKRLTKFCPVALR